MRRAGVIPVWGAILLALLCIALVSFASHPAEAQDGGPTQGQYRGDDVAPPAAPDCPSGFERLSSFNSAEESSDTFRITEEQLRVLYAVTADGDDDVENTGRSFSIEVTQGGETLAEETENDVPASIVEGSLTADITGSGLVLIDVPEFESVVFSVAICQRGTDDGDVDDADDVVPDTADDDPLPNTGGLPVPLGAAGLLVAAALVSRKILAS